MLLQLLHSETPLQGEIVAMIQSSGGCLKPGRGKTRTEFRALCPSEESQCGPARSPAESVLFHVLVCPAHDISQGSPEGCTLGSLHRLGL